MTVDAFEPARPERLAQQIGEPAGDVEQYAITGRPRLRDRGLQQVAGALQLVPLLQIAVPLTTEDKSCVGVQVAVRLLCGSHQGAPVVACQAASSPAGSRACSQATASSHL